MMNHWLALLHRYLSVFRAAWQQRVKLDGTPKRGHEAHFLPAALSLQENPVSPLPRILTWLLMAFAAIALLWAIFGRIEIVATAQGKIIADGHTKIIQPMETATVKAIHVRDGQLVKAGDPLIELDATNTTADQSRVEADLLTAQLDAARAQAFLSVAQHGQGATILNVTGADSTRIADERSRLHGELAEYHAKLARLDAQIAHHQAELQTTHKLVDKLSLTAPIAEQRAGDYKNLLSKNFISKHGYLEKEQVRIETEGDLAAQRAHLLEIQAALETARRERAAFAAEAVRSRHDLLNEAQVKIRQLTQEQRKAVQHASLMTLTAPVDGIVQQLAIHTIGGVVTPAQALLAVVPRDNALEVEVMLENKDIGFVFAGQNAEVKLETFPFTKYGTIPGKVDFVSSDAASDEKRGLIYPAKVQLTRSTMQVENKVVNLSPGMAVTVEIKTGHRRVIEYFLSPLLQYSNESLRER